MRKEIIKKPISIPSSIDVEVFITDDGRAFEVEEDAIIWEQLSLLKIIPFSNFKFISPNIQYNMVYFENERQIELYEQKMCDGDNHTFGSWGSCKNKFCDLPKWIVCGYERFEDSTYSGYYFTLEEAYAQLQRLQDKLVSLGLPSNRCSNYLSLFNLADEQTDTHWFLTQIKSNKFANKVGIENCLKQSAKHLRKNGFKGNGLSFYKAVIDYMCTHYGFADVDTECTDGFINMRTFDFDVDYE